ncbi:MAG: malectin domain-containing carbohydrate-binding protein [Terriglobia bacterium]
METETKDLLERAELQSILSSGIFAKSPNLAKLLNYICEKHWAGDTEHIKEYNLAVEALGRPADFDPSTSAIVRVEVHRLREKLKKFYESEGFGHRVVINLQPGRYAPQFIWNEQATSASQTGLGRIAPPPLKPANANLIPLVQATPPVVSDRPASAGLVQTAAGGEFHRRASTAQLLVATGAALALILAGIFAFRRSEASRIPEATPATTSTSRASPAAGATSQTSVRVIAAYTRKDYVDRSGNVWSADSYFEGGVAGVNESHFIARTADPTLFETYRRGDFSYNIPLKPGNYELWLYFVETKYGPGTILGGGDTSRLFDVSVNGRTILNAFDVFSDAGGNFIADVRVFKSIRPGPDGVLRLQFARRTDEPFVNAIKVIPSPSGKFLPVRIVAQDNSYTDSNGSKWNPDHYYSDGRPETRTGPVSGTSDPGLFEGERYGNFDYAIPVASGKYGVTLYFAERYFGSELPGGGGAGSRVFDVTCNGATLLKNFDIFKEAGGANRAVVRTFHGLEADAQGKLILRFVPVVNYALVDAIEVKDESK